MDTTKLRRIAWSIHWWKAVLIILLSCTTGAAFASTESTYTLEWSSATCSTYETEAGALHLYSTINNSAASNADSTAAYTLAGGYLPGAMAASAPEPVPPTPTPTSTSTPTPTATPTATPTSTPVKRTVLLPAVLDMTGAQEMQSDAALPATPEAIMSPAPTAGNPEANAVEPAGTPTPAATATVVGETVPLETDQLFYIYLPCLANEGSALNH